MASFLMVVSVLALAFMQSASASHDYGEALSKSLLFYEAQRSGRLPNSQRANWRADSGLKDGLANGVDLVGGYYDAGDNVKFGLPMAHTITMLSWSVIEYGKHLANSGELGYSMEAIQWGTDYLLKAHSEPNLLYGQVGDGITDHNCWQRPEDMTTPRYAYKIDTNNPGSDLAGETAAAMAAASIIFKDSNPTYSNELLNHAKQLFDFADKYRGKYDSSITNARKFYGSISGYNLHGFIEQLGIRTTDAGASHAHQGHIGDSRTYRGLGASPDINWSILQPIMVFGSLKGWSMTEFSWDVKYAGVQVLASMFLLQGNGEEKEAVLQKYQEEAEFFMCSCLHNVQRTPGGLLYWQKWNNMHFVTSASFLLTVYSDYLSTAGKKLQCADGQVDPSELLGLAKSQFGGEHAGSLASWQCSRANSRWSSVIESGCVPAISSSHLDTASCTSSTSNCGVQARQYFNEANLLLQQVSNEAGRKRAERRHTFMQDFLTEFYEEWEGKL